MHVHIYLFGSMPFNITKVDQSIFPNISMPSIVLRTMAMMLRGAFLLSLQEMRYESGSLVG